MVVINKDGAVYRLNDAYKIIEKEITTRIKEIVTYENDISSIYSIVGDVLSNYQIDGNKYFINRISIYTDAEHCRDILLIVISIPTNSFDPDTQRMISFIRRKVCWEPVRFEYIPYNEHGDM